MNILQITPPPLIAPIPSNTLPSPEESSNIYVSAAHSTLKTLAAVQSDTTSARKLHTSIINNGHVVNKTNAFFLERTLLAMSSFVGLLFFLYVITVTSSTKSSKSGGNVEPTGGATKSDILQKIEGKVQVTGRASEGWILETKVCLNGGEYCAFPKESGDFVIYNVPPGSYLVEVYSPNFNFEPVRVDISSKNGKIRARKVNLLKAKAVVQVTYPLKFKAASRSTFFEKRESWSLIATLKNPMVTLKALLLYLFFIVSYFFNQVLLLVAPVLLMLVLPRLMKSMDPDTQKVRKHYIMCVILNFCFLFVFLGMYLFRRCRSL